ncbi:MAG: mechanosensitive ion channel family protein [Limnochordia bacterium]|jgi:miniconductance mechanosensitive channel
MALLESQVVKEILLLLFVGAVSSIGYLVIRRHVLGLLQSLFVRSKLQWDEIIIEKGVLHSAALLIPAFIVSQALPFLEVTNEFVLLVLSMWSLVVVTITLDRLLDVVVAVYNTFPVSQRVPITGYVQIVKIALFVFAVVIGFSILVGQSPWAILGGLGALSAVLILVFQNTILSFVAGIQLTMHDQIRVGDWIEMPAYGADGFVEEVALHTIKVRNWDKSMSTIPTHKLMGDSFKNWRFMFESGGRRIKRSILIDQTSVKFCDEKMLERFRRIQLLRPYVEERSREIAEYNHAHNIDPSSLVNGRHMTNLGTFRAYLTAYLRNHPRVHQGMVIMVRQLQPTPDGLPLEIYAFSNDVAWVNYEGVQADIFDHILAAIPEFELRVFQNPSGHDLIKAVEALTKLERMT